MFAKLLVMDHISSCNSKVVTDFGLQILLLIGFRI